MTLSPTQQTAPAPRRPTIGPALHGRRGIRPSLMQLVYILAAFGLGVLIPRISVGDTVSAETTTQLLLTIGGGIVAFVAVVYSLLFLVVQFGTTTFTPRLNLFRDSPIIWHSFGYYLGVLVFSFTAAFAIGDEEQTTILLPIVEVAMLLVSLGMFRVLQTSAFKSIQLAVALDQVGLRGGQVIDGVYPSDVAEAPKDALDLEEEPFASADVRGEVHEIRWPRRAAVLQVINVPRLARVAEQADVLIELRVVTGEVIIQGDVVALVHGRAASALDQAVLKALSVGMERTFEQDPAFPLRILSDIALRALSPAVNDPATAVQALDTMHSLLRILVTRDLDVGRIPGSDGKVRLVIPLPGWDDYLGLAIDEVTIFGTTSPMVRTRLERMLDDLATRAPPDRRSAVESRMQRVQAMAVSR